MPYTLQLINLRCLAVQEVGGDEIYLRLNSEVIFDWKQIGKTFHNRPTFPEQTSEFDFETCTYPTKNNRAKASAYKPEQFIFRHLDGITALELWESDEGEYLRGDDDMFGLLEIDAGHAGQGVKNVVFRYKGAEYGLTYRVSASS